MTPRAVWDRGQRDNPLEGNHQHDNRNGNNETTHQRYGGVSGGNPGDPGGGDDSSDDDRHSRRSGKPSSNKPEPKKRRHTPWDDESSSDEYASISEYSADSLDSVDFDPDDHRIRNHGRSELERRRRRRGRAAHRYELDKLEDYSRRLWVRKIHHKYRSQIKEQVGEPSPVIEGLKSLKVNEPKHYKGQGDVEIFEAWLMKVLRWMSVNRLAGPEAEKLRIQCIGMLLSEKALQWYDDEVASPHRDRDQWTFEDVIIGIFDHCVQMSTVQEAASQFDNVQYDPKKGIKDHCNTLRRWAGRMTNIPDKFTFKRQFIKGLPDYLIREMTKRGAIPDYATVRTMVKTVQCYETDQSLLNYYLKRAKTVPSSSNRHSDHRDRPSRSGSSSQPRSNSPSREKARIINGRRYTPVWKSKSPPRQQINRPTHQYRPYNNDRKPSGNTPRATGGNSGNTKPVDKKQAMCYGCGGVGHYASDPTCPQYGKP
ncbi:hypothetical protein PM082_024160 [Marasmius tenuissimus]|nr:hypothetical protein PM082_024160 [Marasmius tenuissimus]